LISGIGIAGPTLAFWLKAGGLEPTLIEHARQLRTGGYVIDFWGLGYEIAERMKLTRDVQSVGYRVRELRVVDDQGRRLAGFGTSVFRELTNGCYVTLGRSELSRLLFEKVSRTSEVIFGDEIVGLEERGQHVSVEFKRGGVRQFDLVVGADGLHSPVRRLAFGPTCRFERRLGYAVAAFQVSGYRPRDEDVYLMYGRPGRMLGRFTLHDDRSLFLFVFATGDDLLPSTLDGQKALLRSLYGDDMWECPRILEELDGCRDLYFDRVSQVRMQSWSRGRIALVGDAAFCVSLLAGQGSALAMTAAYVLAGELAKAGERHEEAFRRYEALLRTYIEIKQNGAERFAGAFAPKTRWGLWFRNQVINAFAIPGLATLAVGREITDTLALPEYPWQRADNPAVGAAVPATE